jgi:aminoglycoside phosphotransferase (APT) family kinase protein
LITKKQVEDIRKVLINQFPDIHSLFLGEFERVLGGADNEIFSFKVQGKEKQQNLILRLYKKGTAGHVVKTEYQIIHMLHNENLAVPKPFGYSGEDNYFERAFIVMEKIDGELFSDIFLMKKALVNKLVFKFVNNLVKLHEFSWKDHFKDYQINTQVPDIHSDPFSTIKEQMYHTKQKVENYEIEELKPLIVWLNNNIEYYPCEELVLLHRDYHGLNIMVKPNGDLVTLDWGSVRLGDRRLDIGYCILALESMLEASLRAKMVNIYEELSGKSIHGVEYFMVLSNLPLMLRFYSMIVNYDITEENNSTKNTLLVEYRDYCSFILKTIKDITELSFPIIEKVLLTN